MKDKKSILQRRSKEMETFLNSVISEIKENGYPREIHKTQIERLILHHKEIKKIKEDIINGFKGVQKINEKIEAFMNG